MQALHGLRLLDLTHMLSGPYCAMMLGDLGMEVIKIEPPGGERTRRLLADDPAHSRDGIGAYFLTLGRNKKSVVLDLKTDAGQALLHELVARSDALVTNFAAGAIERLGLTYAALAPHNPRLVACAITGFGMTGPDRDHACFDLVAQGIGGGMSITGEPGQPPLRAGLPIGDLTGGMLAAVGILAALQARERTGVGQQVDIGMVDGQISLLNYVATMHLLSGDVPAPLGNSHPVHVPYGTYPCADGWIIVAVIFDGAWEGVVEVTGDARLADPAYRTRAGRLAARATIDATLAEAFAPHPRAHWLERLRAVRVPCAPVNDVAEALASAQVRAREMVVEVASPGGSPVPQPGNPVKLSAHAPRFAPPPRTGEHTDAVLTELLGRTPADLRQLREDGVIG